LKTFVHLIEFGLARILLFLFDTLPYRFNCSVSKAAANLWWWVDRRRQKVAVSNIIRSGIETDPKKARSIAKRSIQNFSMMLVESLQSDQYLEGESWRNHITLDIKPDVRAVLEDPEQPLILAAGHFGNWEIAAHLVSRYKPVAGITRGMNNPYIEKLVKSRKGRYRFRPIPKHDNNAGRLIEELNHKNILALLFDQHAGKYGMMIDFFGHAAATFKTTAMLHLVTKAPLCYAECVRTGPMQFTVTTSHLIRQAPSGNKQADIKAILTTMNGHLENTIRKDPAQYLWAHRRWRD
jgi:Kdo2-lipid IVA lauroyltransferase/acyltransferase